MPQQYYRQKIVKKDGRFLLLLDLNKSEWVFVFEGKERLKDDQLTLPLVLNCNRDNVVKKNKQQQQHDLWLLGMSSAKVQKRITAASQRDKQRAHNGGESGQHQHSSIMHFAVKPTLCEFN